MSKEPLTGREADQASAREKQLVEEITALAGGIAELLTDRAREIARTEQEVVGLVAGAAVSALQLIDGGMFRRPGVTAAALDVLLRWQTDVMRRLAQRNKNDFLVRPDGDSGDTGDREGTPSPASPRPDVENAQENSSAPTTPPSAGTRHAFERGPHKSLSGWPLCAVCLKPEPDIRHRCPGCGFDIGGGHHDPKCPNRPAEYPNECEVAPLGILPASAGAAPMFECPICGKDNADDSKPHAEWCVPELTSKKCSSCEDGYLFTDGSCSFVLCPSNEPDRPAAGAEPPAGELKHLSSTEPHAFTPATNHEIGMCVCGKPISNWVHNATAQVNR